MTGFFLNVRGFNKTSKHEVVRNWVNKHSLQFGSLIETRVKEKKSESIVNSVFRDWSFMANYEHHHLGRIWIV